MSTLRIYKASLAALPQVKMRIHKVSLAAAVPIETRLRVHKVSLAAVGAVIVTIEPEVTVGPGEVVQLEAELVTPGSATWAWRRISGPSIGLSPDGATASFVAPSLWNSDRTQPNGGVPGISTLVVGVRATIDGIQSAEVRCEVDILPQLSWSRGEGTWVGASVAPA